MTESEIEAVRTWLGKAGYPLEYETAREMIRAGYKAWQGRYYEDVETKEHREIDVRADEPDSSANPWRPVHVVAECKNNTKPWLALTTELALPPAYARNLIVSYRFDPKILESGAAGADFLLNVPERHGYSVVQTQPGADTAHAALQSVAKAAIGSVSSWDRPAIAVPMIVLRGSLYQLGYREDGAEILEAVDWIRVVWHGSSARRTALQVDVVTRAYLSAYLDKLRPATRALAKVLASLPQK